jgi:hypothetical protein
MGHPEWVASVSEQMGGANAGSFDFALRAALRMTANLGPLISTFAPESTSVAPFLRLVPECAAT